jgi:hypothetical protein
MSSAGAYAAGGIAATNGAKTSETPEQRRDDDRGQAGARCGNACDTGLVYKRTNRERSLFLPRAESK